MPTLPVGNGTDRGGGNAQLGSPRRGCTAGHHRGGRGMTVAEEPAQVLLAPARLEPTAAAAPDPRRLRLSYLPELDGIRGLGLLVVVVHHAGVVMWSGRPQWFVPGGQVGLDVFFALSGFLITVLLLGEHGRTGGIRVGNFLW